MNPYVLWIFIVGAALAVLFLGAMTIIRGAL